MVTVTTRIEIEAPIDPAVRGSAGVRGMDGRTRELRRYLKRYLGIGTSS